METRELTILNIMRKHIKTNNPEQPIPYEKVYAIAKECVKECLKDVSLTWEDIKRINDLFYLEQDKYGETWNITMEEETCKAVLKKFNEERK